MEFVLQSLDTEILYLSEIPDSVSPLLTTCIFFLLSSLWLASAKDLVVRSSNSVCRLEP